MSAPAVQLSFTLRTSPNVRTVHLLGSWDGYKSQLPLSIAKDAAKPGSWKGTFRFQGAHALKLGSRYWYYYIVDGYHVSHDPAKEHVVEKTTGRKLNILNVPAPAKTAAAAAAPAKPEVKAAAPKATKGAPQGKPSPKGIPQGRPVSPARIAHPKPQKPYASRGLREADYDMSPVDDLEERFSAVRLSTKSDRSNVSSPSTISNSSASSGTEFSSATDDSSESDDSSVGPCRCNRWGVTRDGRRVQLDCGGKRCGYADSDSSECESEDESEDEDVDIRKRAHARLQAERARNGVKAY